MNVISTGVGGITESDVSLAKASSAVGHRLQRASRRQGAAAGRAGRRRHQALPGHLRRHRRRQEGHGRHAGADLAREDARQGRGPPGLHHPQGRHHRRLLRHRGEDHPQGACSGWCATRWSSTPARSARCAGSRTTPRRSPQGYECGLSIEGYNDLREGDIIEAFEIETIAATLDAPEGVLAAGNRAMTVAIARVTLVLADRAVAQRQAFGRASGSRIWCGRSSTSRSPRSTPMTTGSAPSWA